MNSDKTILDLYSGAGGVGNALDELGFRHVGVDNKEKYRSTYAGEFIKADASDPEELINKLPPYDYDLIWMSPPCQAYSVGTYGQTPNPKDDHPTFDDLNVRAVKDALMTHFNADYYIIENVRSCDDLKEPVMLNGFAFDKCLKNERWFEVNFSCQSHKRNSMPSHCEESVNFDVTHELAEAKGVPRSWDRKAIRSAIPDYYVKYLLSQVFDEVEDPRSGGLSEWF